VIAGFGYTYNSANQRTRAGLADGSYWVYDYDKLGQVVSGKRYWSDGTPVAGEQFAYVLTRSKQPYRHLGRGALRAGLRSATYTAKPNEPITHLAVKSLVRSISWGLSCGPTRFC